MRIQQNMDVQNGYIYTSFYQKSSLMGSNKQRPFIGNTSITQGKTNSANPLSKFLNTSSEESSPVSKQMRQMIRELKQEKYAQNSNINAAKDPLNDFSKISGASEDDDEEIVSAEKYNYKTVSSKIQQAKTSLSAGQAVLAAKRETLKIKRMIAAGSGDAEELQLALTHAKRMEMVARKKKHHLELEEMIEHTRKSDERKKELEDAAVDMKNTLIAEEEEKITEKEDAIFDDREEMLDEALERMQEEGATFSEEELKELNQMISEFGEDELEELEESMEMLENMEVVDPHMSKEEFEDLKRKHRASEDKAIVKANMEYLKDMIKHELSKGGSIPGIGGASSSSATALSMPQNAGTSLPTPQMVSMPAIDIQA